jgi:hypothetical protein
LKRSGREHESGWNNMDTYDFESKHIYRQRRETAIDRIAGGNPFTRRVAYLDTKEALDTISYLKRGYQPQNLWAINRNPAEVALLTMKLKSLNLPIVNTVGLDFEKALETRIPEVDVIDFDGMSCLNDRIIDSLSRIVFLRKTGIYGFTILGGRENQKWFQQIKVGHSITRTSFNTEVNTNHSQRLALLLHLLRIPNPELNLLNEDSIKRIQKFPCSYHIQSILWDTYFSISKQPMIWSIIQISKHQELTTLSLSKIIKNKILPLPHCYEDAEQKGYLKKRKGFNRLILQHINWELEFISIERKYLLALRQELIEKEAIK